MARGGTGEDRSRSGGDEFTRAIVPDTAAAADDHVIVPPVPSDTAGIEESVSESAFGFDPPEFDAPVFDPLEFDRRPGQFEATRVPDPVPLVYLHRPDRELWRIAVAVPWQGGVLDLSPARALLLARELIAYAELADEGNAR